MPAPGYALPLAALLALPLAACDVRAQDDAGTASAGTEQSDELTRSVRAVRAERTRVAARLEQLGYPTPAGEANFVYVPGPDGLALDHLLTRSGIRGKVCGTHGFRLTVGDPMVGDAIEAALRRSVA